MINIKNIILVILWFPLSLIIFTVFWHYIDWEGGYCWRCHYGRPFSEYMTDWISYDFSESFIAWIVLSIILFFVYVVVYIIMKFLFKLYSKNRKV